MGFHAEYRQLWINADYPGGMASACAVKPPPPEYLAVYHFISSTNAIHDIENGWIKLTTVSETNDPFEFEGFDLGRGPIRQAIRKIKTDLDKQVGILCFSKDWKSPALWAHYADRHKGICLGFSAKRETLLDVEYHSRRIDGGFTAPPTQLSPQMQNLLMTAKACDWEYEQEVRRCIPLNQALQAGEHRFYKFDDTLKLSEVILGERCCETLEKMRDMVKIKYRAAAVYRARSAWGHYTMVPEERTIP